MDFVVTTAHNPSTNMLKDAALLASLLSAPLKLRAKYSLDAMRGEYGIDTLLVVTKKGPVVYTPGGEYFFHLNMAELRINNLRNGKPDHMISAMGLKPGMTVLDCTLGLATDAIVASFVAGEGGAVLGLESSPIIAAITGLGLQTFSCDDADITSALRRIQVKEADYNLFLSTVPDKSFDVVFFDPMFRVPIIDSSNLRPIRFLADDRPIDALAIKEARRIARYTVVVKEASGSHEFARLGISVTHGGKYSSVHYGAIEMGG
ncbi:MAG: class I SAM-dependent methyltransferase [Negativicutes bacterium]|nr:class I SAM-dependent methyltransferase [Negativicutes bacterium]